MKKFDLFGLGPSAVLSFVLIFYLMPVLSFLGINFKFASSGYNIDQKAMIYLTVGLVFAIIGYYNGLADKITKKIPDIFRGEWDFSRALWVFGVVFVSGLAIKIIKILKGGYFHLAQDPVFVASPLYSAVMMLNWLGYIALIIAFVRYFSLKKAGDNRYRFWRIAAYSVFILEILYALPTCSKLAAIIPIMLCLIVRWYAFRPDYWTVAAAAAAVFLLFPLGTICRGPAILNAYPAIDEQGVNLPNAGIFAADTFLTRINQSHIFSKVIGSNELGDYGRMISDFFVRLAPPRFIWKNKPLSLNAQGNEFGRKIGVLGDTDRMTSVSPAIIGDFYINFGLRGIILGMFLMGFLWRIIYVYFIKKSSGSLSGILFYAVFWIEIVRGIEDWTAPVYAGLVKLFILLMIIHLFLSQPHIKLKFPKFLNL